MKLKVCFLGAVRRRTFICCRNVRISASSAAHDRNRSTTIQTMSLTRSLIPQQHRPILDQLLVRLSLRQGQVLIPMMLARHCGLRGQTVVNVNRKQIVDHDLTGKAMRYYARKNKKIVTLPMMQELQHFLAELKVQRADGMITVRDDGALWPSEKEMQTRVSHWLRDQERGLAMSERERRCTASGYPTPHGGCATAPPLRRC